MDGDDSMPKSLCQAPTEGETEAQVAVLGRLIAEEVDKDSYRHLPPEMLHDTVLADTIEEISRILERLQEIQRRRAEGKMAAAGKLAEALYHDLSQLRGEFSLPGTIRLGFALEWFGRTEDG